MATSAAEDRNFIAAVISSSLLEDAIEWIRKELEPTDVFDEHVLVAWAKQNGYVDSSTLPHAE